MLQAAVPTLPLKRNPGLHPGALSRSLTVRSASSALLSTLYTSSHSTSLIAGSHKPATRLVATMSQWNTRSPHTQSGTTVTQFHDGLLKLPQGARGAICFRLFQGVFVQTGTGRQLWAESNNDPARPFDPKFIVQAHISIPDQIWHLSPSKKTGTEGIAGLIRPASPGEVGFSLSLDLYRAMLAMVSEQLLREEALTNRTSSECMQLC